MADARAIFTEGFEAARTALSQGDLQAADESLRSAVQAARSDPRLQRELAAALIQLGKVAEKRGQGADAEQLLSEALEISERLFGMEHSALAPLLSDLARLHVQQSHHTRAAAVLERLLGIARTKGQEHPEVATALAGLALVKRRIGDHEGAEALYRDALRIREKVLAPDHMGTVVTMEQLAETCAARGKFSEALALLRRALPTREAALGPDHPTVSAARSRLATLEGEAATAASNDPSKLVFLYTPEPRKRPSAPPPPPPRQRTPARAAAVAAAPLMAAAAPVRPAAPVAVPPRQSAPAPAPVPLRASSPMPHEPVHPRGAHRDAASADAPTPSARPLARSAGRGATLYASAGVTAVAVAVAALTLRSRDGGDRDRVATPVSAPAPAAVVARVASMDAPGRTDAPRAVSASDIKLQGAATSPPAPVPSPIPTHVPDVAPTRAEQHVAPEVTPPSTPGAPMLRLDLPRVNLPRVASVDVDSIVRASARLERYTRNDQLGTGLSRSSQVEAPSADTRDTDGDQPAASRPRIIGRAPVPRFPESLRATHPVGVVVVRFEVDERGRANVGGMTVVKSDHELFTAAVREILPLYRFEPAHLATASAKPVAVMVELPFRFSAKR